MDGVVDIPGSWRHRYVAANGARFHVAESAPASGGVASGAPLVVLLHGFPEFWWCWREQLPALASAGYRAAAMDLRGYGGSDKPPRGYDPFTLAGDVAGVVKGLGERSAVVVGHGWGGYVGWAAAALHPREVSGLCAVSAPHPMQMMRLVRTPGSAAARRHLLAMQLPWWPERRMSRPGSRFVARHLGGWSAPGSAFPDEDSISRYQAALSLWPASQRALEYHRWLVRSRLRDDGRRFSAAMRKPIGQRVCTIAGAEDPVIAAGRGTGTAKYVEGPLQQHLLSSVGHFPPEEAPARFNPILLAWLGSRG
jgi:pimeloyl-ACP methyl ester carboxylesterase